MKLPNPERAIVDIRKLRDYCLNPSHGRGRHKARVFASALGLGVDDAEELRAALLDAARTNDAYLLDQDEQGQRYVIEFEMRRGEKRARIRSGWIVRHTEDFARLTTCYVI